MLGCFCKNGVFYFAVISMNSWFSLILDFHVLNMLPDKPFSRISSIETMIGIWSELNGHLPQSVIGYGGHWECTN